MQIAQASDQQWQPYAEWDRLSYGQLLVPFVAYLLHQSLHTTVYHYDESFGDAAGFPVYLLNRFAREQVKVILAGYGGDELFGDIGATLPISLHRVFYIYLRQYTIAWVERQLKSCAYYI